MLILKPEGNQVLEIISLIVWLLAVPFCMGLIFVQWLKESFRTPGVVFIAGYILLFTVLEIVGIPVVLLKNYHGYTTFIRCFTPVILVLAAVGLFFWYKGRKKGYGLNWRREDISLQGKVMLLLFLALVGFQLYMAFTRASFDGDDAYYGVQAVTAQQTDSLYRINPNTGRSAPVDARHGLALFPIWEAYIGTMSGLHATIVCHSVLPLLLIPLTYMLYYQIGRQLLAKRKGLLPMFMVLIALWQMFGNISIYTNETFFLTRTWQGKSFAGNFVIPGVLWLFLCLFPPGEEGYGKVRSGTIRKEEARQIISSNSILWLLLTFLNLAGGASSSLAVLLSCLLTVGLGFLFAVWERRPGVFVKACFSCVAGGAYVLLYVLLSQRIIQL